jgi:hypothetical protein
MFNDSVSYGAVNTRRLGYTTGQFSEIIAVCYEILRKHLALWAEYRNFWY